MFVSVNGLKEYHCLVITEKNITLRNTIEKFWLNAEEISKRIENLAFHPSPSFLMEKYSPLYIV